MYVKSDFHVQIIHQCSCNECCCCLCSVFYSICVCEIHYILWYACVCVCMKHLTKMKFYIGKGYYFRFISFPIGTLNLILSLSSDCRIFYSFPLFVITIILLYIIGKRTNVCYGPDIT